MNIARSLLPMAVALAAFTAAGVAQAKTLPPVGGDQVIQGRAGAIYVDDGGGKDGVPVLFLHSFGGDSSHWASQLDHLRHERRALAIDLRGHGKSATPADQDYRVESMVKDVEAVVDKLAIKRLVIVGHSMGGAVAARYAGANPGRVAGLVLVAAPGKMPAEEAQKVMAAIEANYDATMAQHMDRLLAGAQDNVRTQVLAQVAKVPKAESIAIMRALFANDPLPSIDRYRGPRLIVYTGTGNTPADLQNTRPAIPNRRMAGTSHWPQLDKPKEFDQMLDEFLARVR